MGWGFGVNAEGREVGYTVQAECDETGCMVRIDRGLAYACGNMHDGGEWGCGLYFCGNHLFLGGPDQLCKRCLEFHSADEFSASQCNPDRCVIHDEARLVAAEKDG